jgi:hypothetical protein
MAVKKSTDPKDSPDRDILTPRGCQALLTIGEKALAIFVKQGIPYVETSNSYRFPRAAVLEWMIEESKKPKKGPRGW